MFVGTPPIHEQIYSSGYILDLGAQWIASENIGQFCMNIIKMLESATEKQKPTNDECPFSLMKERSPNDLSKVSSSLKHEDKLDSDLLDTREELKVSRPACGEKDVEFR